jgi:hypothetical protein
MTSDHIAPWSQRQANSGNNWAWLGAALATTSLPFGSLAIPGGWCYHPTVLAHLAGTGRGEILNECVGEAAGRENRNATRGFVPAPGLSEISFAERLSPFDIPGSRRRKQSSGLSPRSRQRYLAPP